MEKTIKLKSRDSDNYLKLLAKSDGTESKTYILKTEFSYMRSGYIKEKQKFIDPSGGPMIIEGEILEEAGMKVKAIDFIEGYGYAITFE